VDIDLGGFAELRPGLSAEVEFEIDRHRDVVRVPVGTIRRFDGDPYVALPTANGHSWRKLTLGAINSTHAEILTGLQPGERVVADPAPLPAPSRMESPAALSGSPIGGG
jgi:multidrug efflux pump subunit AcrA (membrane-fusion protein)